MKQYIANALGVLGLCIAVGMGLYIEMGCSQVPCILCFLQRASMLLIALGLCQNLLCGIQVRYYGFCFLAALLGLMCSLRHMGLNICKPVGEKTFFFCSYRLYTWSFCVFIFSLLCLTFLLFAYSKPVVAPSSWLKRVSLGLVVVTTIVCAISSWCHRGISF